MPSGSACASMCRRIASTKKDVIDAIAFERLREEAAARLFGGGFRHVLLQTAGAPIMMNATRAG